MPRTSTFARLEQLPLVLPSSLPSRVMAFVPSFVMAFVVLFVMAAIAPGTAEAHDPPFATQVVWGPDGGLVLWTNRGMIFGDPATGDFRLMCNLALGINSSERADFTYTPGGDLLVATSGGLITSSDGGCSFHGVAPLEETPLTAMAVDPVSGVLLAASSAPTDRALFGSSDGGATFTQVAPLADDLYYEELAFSPAQADRVYAGGVATGAEFVHFVAVSDDGGANWQRHDVALLDTESDIELLAVHPTDPDSLLVKALDNSTSLLDRLLVSHDAGATFESPLSVVALKSATWSADGQTLWVTGLEGLWVSHDAGATFEEQPGPERMSCAFEHDADLYVCGYFEGTSVNVDGVGVASGGGDSYEPVLLWNEVTEPLACPADAETTTKCEMLWRDWQREYPSGSAQPDAGTPDAGTPDAGTPDAMVPAAGAGPLPTGGTAAPPIGTGGLMPEPPDDDGCGCSVVGRERAARALPAWLSIALLLSWRRRRRTRAAQGGHEQR